MAKAEPKRTPKPRLLIQSGARAGTVVPLILKTTLVGRIDSAQLVFDESTVSRLHARITNEHGSIYVEDLASREGTWVNGVAIARRKLAAGDEVCFGDVQVRFELGD